ncbi:MAG: ABC transporter permease subunit, partial [Anaerolineales bacterium]|nr:ABC transporter permease subunit [Anaerolineales bacterium]
GGYVDTMIASSIEESVGFMMMGDWNRDLPPDERMAAAEELIANMKEARGLNQPFMVRTARWLGDALTLNWGPPERARAYGLNAAGADVRDIILQNLSRTLLVFGLSNVLLFGFAVWFALVLSRRHGGRLDRLVILLSPISSAPAWVIGILVGVFLLRVFGYSPGGAIEAWPGEGNFQYQLSYIMVVLRNLLIPFIAVFLAGFFQSAYIWRSFFQVYRNEDYVDLAYAKGLRNGRIDRLYVIRPALPALLTSFALLLAVLWQEMIALEALFNVQGLGRLFVQALNAHDTPMIVAIVTMFAYLLAIIVFVLDICYILVDPRVRVGGGQAESRPSVRLNWRFRRRRQPTLRPLPEMETAVSPSSWLGLRELANGWVRFARELGQIARSLWQYPSAILGVIIILALLGVSVYAVTTIPYQEAITLWRGDGEIWNRNPRDALPTWINAFRLRDLPPSITLSSAAGDVPKDEVQLSEDLTEVAIPFTFEYNYGDFPQEIILDIKSQFIEKGSHLTVTWIWPDGSERELTSFQPKLSDTYYVSRDERLQRRLRSNVPLERLFLGPEGEATEPQPGTYTMLVQALHFEPDADIDVTFHLVGQVYGLAGTDAQRRDLMIALLWGTPIALGFGLIAAFATSVGGMLIAALGAWFGGAVDRTVQFLTEVNLILPFFPVALMVFVLYSRSIVTILAVTVALTLFGSAVKTYRAAFLQIRSEPYIQAAQVYGASNWRIVVRYMVPRIVTVLVPKLIILVPSYVFLEATLAFLGITDPHLPTWGKLVVAALSYGVHTNSSHLVIFPLALLFITGFAFAMVGIALERIFEPRLRER